MLGVEAAGNAHQRPVAPICFVEFAHTVSASFVADARVLDVSVTLAFDASYGDVDILAHVYQVVVNSNATC